MVEEGRKEKGGESREKRWGKERETRVNEGSGSRGNGWVKRRIFFSCFAPFSTTSETRFCPLVVAL